MQIVIANKKCRTFLRITILISSYVVISGGSHAGSLTVEPPDSTVNKEVTAVAQNWINALLKKDHETLATLSLPEYQAGIRSNLANQKSRLYKALYMVKASPYRKFEKIKDIGVAVLGHKDLRKLGRGTTACFFDRLNPPPMWPNDFALLPSVEKRSDVYCIFLSHSGERWEVSTDFAGS